MSQLESSILLLINFEQEDIELPSSPLQVMTVTKMKILVFHSRSSQSISTEKEASEEYAFVEAKVIFGNIQDFHKAFETWVVGLKGREIKILLLLQNNISQRSIINGSLALALFSMLWTCYASLFRVRWDCMSQEEPSDTSVTSPHSLSGCSHLLFISCSDPDPSLSALKSQLLHHSSYGVVG